MCCNEWLQPNRGSVLWLKRDWWRARDCNHWWISLSLVPFCLTRLPPGMWNREGASFSEIACHCCHLRGSFPMHQASSLQFFVMTLQEIFFGGTVWKPSPQAKKKKKGEMGTAGKSALSAAVAVETTFTQVLLAHSPSRIQLARLIDRFGNTHTQTHRQTHTGAHKHNSGKMIKSVAHLLVCTLATDSPLFPVYWDIVHATICPFFMFAVRT